METGKAIYYLLKDSDAVGAICADRIYPEIAQQDADAPFIAYTVIDTTPSGTKTSSSNLDTARCEIYMISDDYAQAMDLGIAVRAALDRQGGDIGPAGSTVAVQSIDFESSDIDHDEEHGVYIVEHTYNIRVQRTGQAGSFTVVPSNAITVEEVDGTPSGPVTKLVFTNGTVSIVGTTATVQSGGGGTLTVREDDGGNSATTSILEFPVDSITHSAGTATLDALQMLASAIGDDANVTGAYFANGLVGDFDQDGYVGSADLIIFLSWFGYSVEDIQLAVNRASATQTNNNSPFFSNAQHSAAVATKTALENAGHVVEYFEGINTALGGGYVPDWEADTVSGSTVRRTLYISSTSFPTSLSQFQVYPLGPYDDTARATVQAVIDAFMQGSTGNVSIVCIRTLVSDTPDKLLDTYTGAAAAYSVRLLDKDYTGNCMRIRRDSDDAETDIGFDSSGDLDTASIASHCGSANGYVVTWYDQSGNSNNATQSTAGNQPQIYNGSAVITENGKPAMTWANATNQNLTLAALNLSTKTIAMVWTPINSSITSRGFTSYAGTGGVGNEFLLDRTNNATHRYYDGGISATVSSSAAQNLTFAYRNSSVIGLGVNGATVTTASTPNANASTLDYHIGDEGGTAAEYVNYHQEVIIWGSDQSTNRTGIETDINGYFSIY